jgi:hypothetical protein
MSEPVPVAWYHGTSGHDVALEAADGQFLGPLPHLPEATSARHSPTGFSWGYGGSGPADLARSILIHALGEDARCPDCAGTGKVVYRLDDGEGASPYNPRVSPGEYGDAGFTVSSCWADDCGSGYRRLPYQDFKFQFVATWPAHGEWRMSRADVLAWLEARGAVRTAGA